jgi:hypothetical protein
MLLKRFAVLTGGVAFVFVPVHAQEPSSRARTLERTAEVKELTAQLQVRNQADQKRFTPVYRDRLTNKVRRLIKE